MNLRIIVEPDDQGDYVAEVPAFPGYFSQGKTREEAIWPKAVNG